MLVIFKTIELEELYIIPADNIKGKLPFQKSLINRYKDRIVLLESIEKYQICISINRYTLKN
jgi:hypothetical protein